MHYSDYDGGHNSIEWLKELIQLAKECHDDGETLTFILENGKKIGLRKDELSEYLRKHGYYPF